MEILYSIILGIIQGLTEFLPVSSSGHLVILHQIFDLNGIDDLAFDAALHLGTLVAIIIFFFNDIIRYIKAFLNSIVKWDLKNNLDQRLSWYILISMIPAGIVGFFWEDIIKNFFRSALLVAIVLIIVSFFFILAEWYSKRSQGFQSLTWLKALIIGLAQALALIPGVSRSGITIITGLSYHLKREAAARFSFLMSIPIVFAAGMKKVYDLSQQGLVFDQLILYIIGFLSAAIIGYFCIKYFLQFVKKYSLNIFAYYRIILGVIILLLIYLQIL